MSPPSSRVPMRSRYNYNIKNIVARRPARYSYKIYISSGSAPDLRTTRVGTLYMTRGVTQGVKVCFMWS